MGDIEELDRQVERGSLFTQATLERAFRRIGNAEGLLSRLVDQLLAQGVVSADDLGVTMEDPPDDDPPEETSATIVWPSVTLRLDGEDSSAAPERFVDCAARLPVCGAVCCRLKFPLSPEEVDAGTVKWDIGHPYIIRQSTDGFCSHHNPSSGGCAVYEDRPGVCRRYTCAGDTRIWADFDNMVLNHAWIEANLNAADLHVARVVPSMEVPVTMGPTRNGASS